MADFIATDYETYREIMGELVSPIIAKGLDIDTLKRLYESKAVYLENLRVKCFWELNTNQEKTYFKQSDYVLILQALEDTKSQLRNMIICAINDNLERRRAS